MNFDDKNYSFIFSNVKWKFIISFLYKQGWKHELCRQDNQLMKSDIFNHITVIFTSQHCIYIYPLYGYRHGIRLYNKGIYL